ncbi:hypothetical protein HYO65_gp190 [Tenacibaculum phage PTm1]|uniref:Uncharacterized protein n=2 Tax=Shirahamavirus PTm1 TaxID=2846435 RepID=A0A5S9HY69_9CAUD|nr:hypothetical protein HYO65_gp190 [Tenacibaculum phage PTm1]BBI90582.1 hypothetical protein [Tenacibaculum phage PTm1]BBI90890.1 hypothetical protein [Tenacibaculum phage PTm5]
MKVEQTKCPNLCFNGSVKHFTEDRALFTMDNCKFCKGTGTVPKDEYESINKSI